MPTVLLCPHGHQWETADDQGTATCPTCGSAPISPRPLGEGLEAREDARPTREMRPGVDTVDDPGATRDFDGPKPADTMRKAAAIPGYEIIEELGHGGMGVVYKARQIALKRMVAIKMIRSGAHASEHERARFRQEAEAVARLQHPNIVQIHEIGAHDGHLYITLEYVDGGSLSTRLATRTPEPRSAAAQVEVLARAMHYAHQRGIIHRDLKPANVLLTAHGDLKITDFGLAKQLDDDLGHTNTGAILGTPSYMAPEQAEGRTKDISPLTDVYALGAILYQMLAGRPPFVGDAHLSVLKQVVSDEPMAPSKIRGKVPRDLETICLKALAKDPKQRYASAEALAQDLARFLAGDMIHARRTNLVVRFARYMWRRPAVLVSALVLWFAIGISSYFLLQDRLYSRADALVKQVDRALEVEPWTQERLQALDGVFLELDALDPEKASIARGRAHRRSADAIRQMFAMDKAPVLRDADIQVIEKELNLFAQRDTALAAEVQKKLQERLRSSQTKDLRAPFQERAEFFDVKDVQVTGQTLEILAGAKSKPARTLLRIPSQGKVDMTAAFTSKAWADAKGLRLLLNARDKQAYAFDLRAYKVSAGDSPLESEAPATFSEARMVQGIVRARILRNDVILREDEFRISELPDAALTLSVGRDGDRLSFQINDNAALLFYDGFPLSGPPGVFALECPHGTRLDQVTLSYQVLPDKASALERGDLLYTEGKYREAFEFYQRQETPPLTTAPGQEVRYKRGACLMALNREDEAAKWFEEVMFAQGQRWPAMAGCQLWLVRYRQKKFADVDAIFLTLAERFPPATLVSMFPEEVRAHLFLANTVDGQLNDFVRFDPQRVNRLERITSLADAVKLEDRRKLQLGLALVRAYHLAGDFDAAVRHARKLLEEPSTQRPGTIETVNLHYRIRVCEELAFLLRLQGRAAEALKDIDFRLVESPGKYRQPYIPLLLERARVHAALDQWQLAENDLDAFFQARETYVKDYRYYAEASLLYGFLRERRGDKSGAQKAWTEGTSPRWHERRPKMLQGDAFEPETPAGVGFVTHLMLASLSDQLTKEDTQVVTKMALSTAMDPAHALFFQDFFQLPPSLFSKGWQSPRGKESAKKMAFKSVTWAEYLRAPQVLTGYSFVRQNALPEQATSDQEDLAWQLAEMVLDSVQNKGTLSKSDLTYLALTWKGVNKVLSWSLVAPKMEPAMRAPMAYVMGHRMLRLKNSDAGDYFRLALKEAPANSTLARLAQAEVDRLKK